VQVTINGVQEVFAYFGETKMDLIQFMICVVWASDSYLT